jgi:hypothetical protein
MLDTVELNCDSSLWSGRLSHVSPFILGHDGYLELRCNSSLWSERLYHVPTFISDYKTILKIYHITRLLLL